MSDQSKYQNHIEQAIQNVLSKVKHPGRMARSVSSPLHPENSEQQPQQKTPAKKRSPSQISQVKSTIKPKSAFDSPKPLSSQEPPKNSAQLKHADKANTHLEADPIYLEAEDLFTPVPLQEESETETEDIPLIEDSYQAPYNIFEEFVETELDILLARYMDICRCSQCRSDIVALALQQLPAYYVTGTRGTLTAKSVIWTRYMQQIMDAVTKAIHLVYKRPRSNCRKIKQFIWVRPTIEEVSNSQNESTETPMFGDIHDADLELEFSQEIEEIIQTLEQASAADKAQLLPVSSPVVQQSYNIYQTVDPGLLQAEPQPQSETVDLQLLDIDDWEEQEK